MLMKLSFGVHCSHEKYLLTGELNPVGSLSKSPCKVTASNGIYFADPLVDKAPLPCKALRVNMKKVSRFAAQPKGTYGNVAPPSFSNQMARPSLAVAPPAPSRPVRDYFDDDEDEPVSNAYPAVGTTDDDDYDPLDDFMYVGRFRSCI